MLKRQFPHPNPGAPEPTQKARPMKKCLKNIVPRFCTD